MSTTRGKTTPASTEGSWKPHAGARSRVQLSVDRVQDMACVAHDEQMLQLLANVADTARHAARHDAAVQHFLGRRSQQPLAHAEALTALHDLVAAGDARNLSYGMQPSEMIAANQQAHTAAADARAALNAHEAGYEGWDRYFLVTSSDGHVHSNMNCSTCNKGRTATGFALLPRLSDTSTDSAVAALGAALCSVCFPDAPVDQREQTKLPARLVQLLVSDGEAAFRAGLDEYQRKTAANAQTRCPGSSTGNIVTGSVRARYPSNVARCADCGQMQSMTSAGNLRPHKAK